MKKAKILVVDDDPAIRMLAAMALKNAGYQVFEAASGPEALTRCQTMSFELIVLDNAMPGMRGPDVARRLRQQEPTATTPIMMLSGLDGDDEQWEGWQAGVNLYVTKPFDDDVLAAQVARLLRPSA